MEDLKTKIEKFITDENELDDRKEKISPSGRFKLLMRYYKTKEGCWNFSRGTIYKLEDGKEICDIVRNYGIFHHSFVNKNNQEWLIAGRKYTSQTIVNLDTGEEFEPENTDGNGFCWTEAFLSPDENTLVVDGCYWACPYEYRFFDFTDPSKGWKELDTGKKSLYADEGTKIIWNEDGTFTYTASRKFFKPLNKYDDDIRYEEIKENSVEEAYEDENNYTFIETKKITFKREDNKLVKTNIWISAEEQQRVDEQNRRSKEWDEEIANYKATNLLYLKIYELIEKYNLSVEEYESYGFTFKGWCPHYEGSDTRFCRRIIDEETNIDLEWGMKEAPILVATYPNKKIEKNWFPHSIGGVEEAFNFILNYRKNK